MGPLNIICTCMFISCTVVFHCVSVVPATKHPFANSICTSVIAFLNLWSAKWVIYLFQLYCPPFCVEMTTAHFDDKNKPTALSITTLNLIYPHLCIFEYMIICCSACFCLMSGSFIVVHVLVTGCDVTLNFPSMCPFWRWKTPMPHFFSLFFCAANGWWWNN